MTPWQRRISTTAIAAVTLCGLAVPSFAGLSRVSQNGDLDGWSRGSGKFGDGSMSGPSMSADGHYVAFPTDAENLRLRAGNPGDTVAVLHNTQTGQNTLASPTYDNQPAYGGVEGVSVSADGRYVVFSTWSSNMVANDTNNAGDVFVRDTWMGTTARVSVPDGGGEANGDSWTTSRCISADGRYIVFTSSASNLIGNSDTNDNDDVFVRDIQAGRTYLISKSTGGVQSNSESMEASITPSGRYITYFSFADNLVPGLVGQMPRVYLADTDPTQKKTSLVAVGVLSSVSSDGRYVAYTTLPGTVSTWGQVYVHDMTAGTDKALSVAPDGVTLGNKDSLIGWISDSGRNVAFTSKARNLVADDTNEETDAFVRDLQTNTTTRISVGVDGLQGSRASGYGYPSGDGRYVAFVSGCEDFVTMDFNEAADVFMAGPLFAVGFKTIDALTAAAIVGGKKIATSEEKAAFNVVKTGAGANTVDMADAVRIARMAAGLDTQ